MDRLLTEEKYKAVLMAQGLPEVCCPYDADAIAVLKTQRQATLEEVRELGYHILRTECGGIYHAGEGAGLEKLLKAIEGLE